MIKKDLKKLAKDSFVKRNINEKKMLNFASKMDRKNLKAFIRELKALEKENNIYIALPDLKSYNTSRQIFQSIAMGKNIKVKEDPSLISGLRITQADTIFESSLNNILENMLAEIEKNYN